MTARAGPRSPSSTSSTRTSRTSAPSSARSRRRCSSIKLEQKLSKKEILERYLNTVYFGRGAYGVQAAAQAYFSEDVSHLDLPESASSPA